jgi:replication factor A1
MAIKDLQAKQGKVDITVEVIDVSDPKEFTKFDKPGRVANAVVKDSTGEIALTLWNDEIDKVRKGAMIRIANGYVNEYKGELQLSAGRFGTIEVLDGDVVSNDENILTEDELTEEELLSAKASMESDEDVLTSDEETEEEYLSDGKPSKHDDEDIKVEEEEVK